MQLLALVLAPLMVAFRFFMMSVLTYLLTYGLRYILTAIGVGFVSYVGVDFALGEVESLLNTHLSGLPADIYALFVFIGGADALAIIMSAVSSCMAIKTVSLVSKISFKKNAGFWE